MARSHKYLFWTDLETTGSTLDDNQIIEVGAAITDTDLNVLSGRSYVLPIMMKVDMKPVVIEMHTKNGLLKDTMNPFVYTSQDVVDYELAQWVREFNGSNHMLLAGSGVMHFDRQFIKRDLPLLNDRLTYYAFDVGVMRRGYEILLGGEDWPADGKTHRAFDDVLFHIEEAKFVLDKLRRGMVSSQKED
jgi:oligoribonuclease